MPQRDYVFFYLNGEVIHASGEELFLNLTDFLRLRKGLSGTKVVCAEGDCGACTVLRAFPKPGDRRQPSFDAINACIVRVAQMDASSLVTIEGLRRLAPASELHPIQEAMVRCHGAQCGFCTPGFVMSLAAAFEKGPLLEAQSVKNKLTGNLCRCTGYQPIIDAALSVDASKASRAASVYLTSPMLAMLRKVQKLGVCGGTKEVRFEAPATEAELRRLRKKFPKATLLAAGTDLGVAANKGRFAARHFLSLHLLAPLYKIKASGRALHFGARVTLSEFRQALEGTPSLGEFFNIFASPQIKNFATVAGNVANASPIADAPPFLLALDAELEIFSPRKASLRKIPIKDFYLAYKETDLREGELIWAISLKLPTPSERFSFAKISQRRDLDISCVNVGFFFRPSAKIASRPSALRLAVGGVGPTPLRLLQTEAFLMKEGLNARTCKEALSRAQAEIKPLSDLRGSSAYRRLVTQNLLEKFLRSLPQEESLGADQL
jgi:xanthine dehydrogenase small subunit